LWNPPPFNTPAKERTNIPTQEDFIIQIEQPRTPRDVTAPPTELPPPPSVVTPAPVPATPLAPAPKAEQPVPGVN